MELTSARARQIELEYGGVKPLENAAQQRPSIITLGVHEFFQFL